MIDSLGHSATAYEAAKERLDRKYGGRQRQIAIYLQELEQFPQIRSGNAKDIEDFADLLDIAMINLKEAGQHQELGDGSLYTKLQGKVAQAYNKCIEQYSVKGYITKIQEPERSTSRWYLPHFPVIKPEKDTTKVRIVFDA